MTEKRPSFQWYPKDYLTDERVEGMTLEQEGAYRRLMDYEWLHRGLPTDVDTLARMCRTSPANFQKMWPKLEPCFKKMKGGKRMYHPRLKRERCKQDEWVKKSQKGGRKSAKARAANTAPTLDKSKGGSQVVAPLVDGGLQPKSNTSSSSASSTPVTTTTTTRETRTRATHLPDAWEPTEKHGTLATAEGVDVEREAIKFRDHALGAGRTQLDWDRTFNNWLRRAKEFGGRRGKGEHDSEKFRRDLDAEMDRQGVIRHHD